jgi:hypothetical protein
MMHGYHAQMVVFVSDKLADGYHFLLSIITIIKVPRVAIKEIIAHANMIYEAIMGISLKGL